MWREFFKKIDWVLMGITGLLLASGLATFFAMGPESYGVLLRHAGLIAIAVAVLIGVSLIDYRLFRHSSAPALTLYIVTVVMLGLTLAEQKIRGASSWLEWWGVRFEPSEFAKLALLIFLSKYFFPKHF